MDQGASMVATLNRLPITHCCFGNHEADLQLEDIAMYVAAAVRTPCAHASATARPCMPLFTGCLLLLQPRLRVPRQVA